MKQLFALMCLGFVFVSCEKSADSVSANSNSASSYDESTTATQATFFAFNKNAQGWTVENGGSLSYSASEGNPAGSIRGTDESATTYWYFSAPSSFLNELHLLKTAANYKLRYDLKAPSASIKNRADIIIASPDITVVTAMPDNPNNDTWTRYEVPLTTAGNWRIGTVTGAAATNLQIKKALHSAQKLWIRGQYSDDADGVGFLDNVGAAKL